MSLRYVSLAESMGSTCTFVTELTYIITRPFLDSLEHAISAMKTWQVNDAMVVIMTKGF